MIIILDAQLLLLLLVGMTSRESLIPLRPGAQNVVAAGGGSC